MPELTPARGGPSVPGYARYKGAYQIESVSSRLAGDSGAISLAYGKLQATSGQRFLSYLFSLAEIQNRLASLLFDLRVKWPSLPDLGGQGVCLYVLQLTAFVSFELRP